MPTFYKINGSNFEDYYIYRDVFMQGNLWAWGYNGYGQLGDNTIVDKSSPVQTIAAGTNWKQVSNGYRHFSAIKTDGTLWLWGDNTSGQLGDNTVTNNSSPVQTVASGTNWKQSSCSKSLNSFSMAIKTDGTLWTWGDNTFGQLGDNTITNKSSPVQTVSGGANWKQVECGGLFSAAIKTSGRLWTWGNNQYGQLGDNTTISKSSPVQTVSGGTDWKQVSCGYRHIAAIKTDGTLWSWGNNAYGVLGDGTSVGKSSPVQDISGGTNWKQVSAGTYNTSAIKTDGTLWLWGDNSYGQLGNGANDSVNGMSSPVQTISSGTNWKQINCVWGRSAAIKTDGTLWTWGWNPYGQLGDNTTTWKSSPVQTVSGGTNWKQVSGGLHSTVAITDIY